MGRTIPLLAVMAVSGLACSDPFSIPTTLVVITDSYQFVPDTVTITHGTTIEWKNESAQYHLVQGDSIEPGGLREIQLAPVGGQDREYPHTDGSLIMTEPGTYLYHCAIHTQMHGVLIVR
ncbi:MAG TPA: plastocyanin/azurin family copper-binding protein [Gemmatimonadales bacterium]|nr:plastocyanin/azurin family copper-binding protein [Gemmatimonadales bacterium]